LKRTSGKPNRTS